MLKKLLGVLIPTMAFLVVSEATANKSFAAEAADADSVELKIQVTGVDNNNGTLRIALYSDPDGWGKDMKSEKTENQHDAKKLDAKKGTMTVTFHVVPGAYAVSLFHDEDKNGKVNKNFFGIPNEEFGFSRDFNPKSKLRAPKFDECEFEVKESTEMKIKLQ